jgi:hypothetical protein
VIVVGDNASDDVEAAQKLGLATFWITDGSKPPPEVDGAGLPGGAGWVDEVLQWIDTLKGDDLAPKFDTPASILAVLKATPAAINTLVRGLSPEEWNLRPQPDEWNLTEILCHLRDSEKEVYLPRPQRILQEKDPFITGIDTDLWAKERSYAKQDGLAALEEFMSARKELLDLLSDFRQDEWQRPARHSIFGPTNIQELVGFTARHDRLHLNQIHNLLKIARK